MRLRLTEQDSKLLKVQHLAKMIVKMVIRLPSDTCRMEQLQSEEPIEIHKIQHSRQYQNRQHQNRNIQSLSKNNLVSQKT